MSEFLEAYWHDAPAVIYLFHRCAKKERVCEFFIRDLKDIKWSEVSMNGFIEFDGYFYGEEADFNSNPYIMSVYSKDHITPSFIHNYGIIFERKVVVKDTSLPENFSNDDPEENICFFPTEHQRLVFKIVEIFDSFHTTEMMVEKMVPKVVG